MVRFLDTNVLLRFLINDDKPKAEATLELLKRVNSGEEKLVTTDVVLAELVWVLESPRSYGLSRSEIADFIESIVAVRGLHIPGKSLFPRVIELYRKGDIDFVDAYNAAAMERAGVQEIYSYDRHFDLIGSVRRLEP